MDLAGYLTESQKLNDVLNIAVLSGKEDQLYDTCKDIVAANTYTMYYLAVNKMACTEYADARHLFQCVYMLTSDSSLKCLAGIRICICSVLLGDVFTADWNYDVLLGNGGTDVTSLRLQSEFYFLVAWYGYLRKKDMNNIVECVRLGYRFGRRLRLYSEGFLFLIQSVRERAHNDKMPDLCYKLDLILNEIQLHGNPTDEQRQYLLSANK